MSLPALIGFAGVLVAAVATGLLAGRAARQPRLDTILWTAAALALTVALAAQSVGFASGFGSATFRAVQLFALLLAPLWLAWGLVELVWPGEAARFGIRLACGALTVVGSVILATDPLTAEPFGKAWPLAGAHYQPPSHYALDVVQAVAVILAGASIGLAAARARTDGPWPGALPGTAAVSLAVFMTVGLRFSLPTRSAYPLLSLLAAALAWFGASRLETRRKDLFVTSNHHGPRAPGELRASGDPARWTEAGRRPPAAPWPRGGPGPDGRLLAPPQMQPGPGPAAAAPGAPAPEYAPLAKPAAPATPPYGRILIFTLLDDRVADFDRFAEQAAEEVRTREPDTLVYVIHLVPNAPMQRIFYEIYRDRAAFDTHENQPYMKRFVADRRACVLATNVIELTLKYAKVAPLPNPQAPSPSGPAPAAPRTQFPPGQFPPGQAPGAKGPLRPQSLEPLPPRPDRRLPSAERRYGGI
jgi:quinol monooxygenase YgiN